MGQAARAGRWAAASSTSGNRALHQRHKARRPRSAAAAMLRYFIRPHLLPDATADCAAAARLRCERPIRLRREFIGPSNPARAYAPLVAALGAAASWRPPLTADRTLESQTLCDRRLVCTCCCSRPGQRLPSSACGGRVCRPKAAPPSLASWPRLLASPHTRRVPCPACL